MGFSWLDKLFDLPPGAVSESLGGLVSLSGAVLVVGVGRDEAEAVDADTVSGQ